MIRLEDLTYHRRVEGRRRPIFAGLNAVFPAGASVGLLGRNGAGKSTLLQVIAGTLRPHAGRVAFRGSISWPVGFAGSFHGDLSGLQNTRFVARIHGVDSDELVDFVEDFADLGPWFRQPFRSYSSGMRARLAFGVSMGIRFDTYLVDEVTSVGDADFRQRSEAVFAARLRESGALIVSHSMELLRRHCTMGAVLEEGRLVMHERVEDAISHHLSNMLLRREIEAGSA